MQQSSVATARAVCVVQLRDRPELIESNCRTCVMNIGDEVQTVFYTSRGAPNLVWATWMCLSGCWVQPSPTDLVIWTSSQMTFGQDKWTGRTEGTRDKRRGTERLVTDCTIGACQVSQSWLVLM